MKRSVVVRRSVVPVALVALALVAVACVPAAPPASPTVLAAACNNTLIASTDGTVASASLAEISGVVSSRRADGVYWVHNDSGDSARVFAIGANGRDLGVYSLSGATAVDWEDIAVGPGPSSGVSYLYLADIGDNAKSRASVVVYRVPEPLVNPAASAPAPQTLTGVNALNFTYPDGPHDAEALIVDPTSGELYIITKELAAGTAQVFSAPANLAAGSTTALVQVASLSLGAGQGVTGADVTPAGDVVGLRTYLSVVLFPRPAGQSLAQAFSQTSCAGAAPPFGTSTAASEGQGEAIGFTRDGLGYVTLSEGAHAAVHRFRAP